MTMQPSSTIFKVKRPDGSIWDIPEQNLDKALSLGGEVVEDQMSPPNLSQPTQEPMQTSQQSEKMFKVKRPDGSIWDIPEENLERAKQLGGQVIEQAADPEYDGFLKTAARTAKTIGSEIVGTIPDLATSIYNIPASIQNATKASMEKIDPNYMGENDFIPVSQQQDLPLIPSVAGAVDSAIDEATNDYTKTQEGDSLQAGLKIASAVATPGGLAKAAAKSGQKATSKVLGALGTTNPTGLAAAGATGVGSSEASKAGYGTAASMGLGLAAGAGVGAVTSVAKGLNTRIAFAKLTGNSPKNFDQKSIAAYEAADLPFSNVTVNESRPLKLIDEFVDKIPVYGTRRNRNLRADDQAYAKAVEGAIDKVGKKIIETESPSSLDIGDTIRGVFEDTLDNVKQEKNKFYDRQAQLLPQGAQTVPSSLPETIDNIRKNIKTLRPTTDETFLLKYLDDLEGGLSFKGNGVKTVVPVSVEILIGTKRSLNDTINWEVNTSGVRSQLKELQRAAQNDIESYGKTNPEWYKAYREADAFYGRRLGDKALSSDTVSKKILGEANPEKIIGNLNDISDFKALKQSLDVSDSGSKFYDSIKREKLTDLLMGKIIDPKTEGVNYTGFATALSNPKTKELIKYLAGDQYGELVKFNNVAKAAIRRNRRIVNPSGSATTGIVAKGFIGLLSGGSAIKTLGASLASTAEGAAAIGILGHGLNWLITNKSAFKMGYEGAKKLAAGDTKAANIFSNRLERAMAKDLGEDFVKQFIAESNQ